MNTPEKAAKLWCPMARVAQVGAVETHAAYNRTINKTHRVVRATWATADTFEPGGEPAEPREITILEVDTAVSGASRCLVDQCAMWRWADPESGFCGLAGRPEVVA